MKVEYRHLSDARDVARLLAQLSVRTAIIDIEPVVADWDSSQQRLDQGIACAVGQVSAVPGLTAICFATNSARRPSTLPATAGVSYLASAHKPLRTGPFLDLPRPAVVIGDQILTDGLLARRLGCTFLHYRPKIASMPAGTLLLYALGTLLRPLLFRSDGR